MTREKLKELISEQKKNISLARQAIEDAQTNFWTEWLVENPTATTRERFSVFCEFGPKFDYNFIQHVVSKKGHDMGRTFEFDRRQKIKIDDLCEMLEYRLSNPTEPTKELKVFGYRDSSKPPVVEQDVLDWMEALIEMNFGSMIYDW